MRSGIKLRCSSCLCDLSLLLCQRTLVLSIVQYQQMFCSRVKVNQFSWDGTSSTWSAAGQDLAPVYWFIVHLFVFFLDGLGPHFSERPTWINRTPWTAWTSWRTRCQNQEWNFHFASKLSLTETPGIVYLLLVCFLFRSRWFSRPAGGTRYKFSWNIFRRTPASTSKSVIMHVSLLRPWRCLSSKRCLRFRTY